MTGESIFQALRSWARGVKRDGVALWFACRHPDMPWLVKGLCLFVVAYALSPIDLIPDFIPVLGYVDDVLLLPGLIWLAVRLMPESVLAASRVRADQWMSERGKKPQSYAGAGLVVAVWILIAYLCWRWFGG